MFFPKRITPSTDDGVTYSSMKVSELKNLLEQKNIPYKSSDKKEDLIELLKKEGQSND
ncbi:HeH/LEM domain-containing protein [Enterococcus faecalis]|uniref:HeH/LEM domain-containing protein n=1 Tax=Enterococcus faecalis TaxID=1351 RepID=UPI003F74617E